jgi:hypothetical protein
MSEYPACQVPVPALIKSCAKVQALLAFFRSMLRKEGPKVALLLPAVLRFVCL